MIRNGYVRVYIEGRGICRLEEITEIPKTWYLVIDRLKWKEKSSKRFLDSVELAYVVGKNTVGILRETLTLFSRNFSDAIGPISQITPELLLAKSDWVLVSSALEQVLLKRKSVLIVTLLGYPILLDCMGLKIAISKNV